MKAFDPVVVSRFEIKKCAKKQIVYRGVNKFWPIMVFAFAHNYIKACQNFVNQLWDVCLRVRLQVSGQKNYYFTTGIFKARVHGLCQPERFGMAKRANGFFKF